MKTLTTAGAWRAWGIACWLTICMCTGLCIGSIRDGHHGWAVAMSLEGVALAWTWRWMAKQKGLDHG